MFQVNKVNELLVETKYSKLSLSKAIGTPYTTLIDRLNGKYKFTADEAYKIAKFFNVDMEYFYN